MLSKSKWFKRYRMKENGIGTTKRSLIFFIARFFLIYFSLVHSFSIYFISIARNTTKINKPCCCCCCCWKSCQCDWPWWCARLIRIFQFFLLSLLLLFSMCFWFAQFSTIMESVFLDKETAGIKIYGFQFCFSSGIFGAFHVPFYIFVLFFRLRW